jgi:hypothetical protein
MGRKIERVRDMVLLDRRLTLDEVAKHLQIIFKFKVCISIADNY